ncbi:MAG: LptF/LptG family permease [Pyramidobacter sp.]|nr:LptF/LptG family permease [Pyramidobacter sp.]
MKSFHILDRLIIKEVRGPFLFGVMAFTLIMVAGGLLFKLANLIIERGVSFAVAGRLFLYELPSVVVLTLPMSCLLASLLGFSKMSSNSEIVALKAAGVSFSRISRPVLISSCFVTLFSLGLNETLVPMGKVAAQNIMRYEIAHEKPALLKHQVFLKSRADSNGVHRIIYINKLHARDGTMEDVLVQEFQGARLFRLTTSDKGKWVSGVWYLQDGEVFEVKGKGKIQQTMSFKQQKLPISLTPQQIANSTIDPEDMNCAELLKYIEVMRDQGKNLDPLWVIFHLRIAVPFACVILSMIGASLGVRHVRRGSASVGFGQSILIVFVYYVVMSMGQSFGQTGYINPVVGAWLPNIIFFCCAMLLARRADR